MIVIDMIKWLWLFYTNNNIVQRLQVTDENKRLIVN